MTDIRKQMDYLIRFLNVIKNNDTIRSEILSQKHCIECLSPLKFKSKDKYGEFWFCDNATCSLAKQPISL